MRKPDDVTTGSDVPKVPPDAGTTEDEEVGMCWLADAMGARQPAAPTRRSAEPTPAAGSRKDRNEVCAGVIVTNVEGGRAGMRLTGYPKKVRLQTGTEVTLRPMVKEDAGKLHAFFKRVPREDRLFLREDVSVRDVIDAWANELDYNRILPLLAEVEGNIVGDATLHRRTFGWTSHIGKVRVVVDKDYRGNGLGTIMLEELVRIAKRARLEQLVAELMADQAAAIAAFRRIGFEKEATFYSYVKDQTGEPRNLVVMIKNLQVEPAITVF